MVLIGASYVVHRDDAFMFQPGDDPGFALEAVTQACVAEHFPAQDLERDDTAEFRIVCTVDFRHSPGPQFLKELISTKCPFHALSITSQAIPHQCISITDFAPILIYCSILSS